MKVRKSFVLAGLAGSVCATSTFAQQVVYDNTFTALPNLTGAVAAGQANGYEIGDEIAFGGISREISEITIIFHVLGAVGGTADTQVRIYPVDLAGPGPVLWDSGILPAMPHIAGLNNLVLAVPNVIVPEEVIWTIHHTNRAGSVEAMGPRLYNPPTVGTSDNFFWANNAPGFPGWASLWYGGAPFANFGAKFVATGTVVTGACCLPDGTCTIISAGECGQQQGLYQGDNIACNQVFCRQPGACCLPAGNCLLTAQHVCEAQGGTYSGDGITCAAANCPVPGACCLPGGECIVTSSAECTLANGTYSGDGTLCGPVSCSTAPVLLNNGPLSTGEFSSGFMQAPPGTTWSELQGVPGCSNTIFGFGVVGAARIADNFIIPGPEGWTIEKIAVFGYQTLGAPQTPPVSPFTAGTIRIWNGRPGDAGSAVVFGDTTTNRLATSTFANMYRTAAATNELRPLFRNELTVNTTLPPGTYWVDFSLTSSGNGTGFSPPVTVASSRGPAGANAVQQTVANGPWNPMIDTGTCNIPRAQDAAFIVFGTIGGGVCYANCDQSTQNPILNVDDFTCFINAYAAAQSLPHAQQVTSYANCDGSTVVPALNVDDFTCFINAYSVGCP
jgi:hypothetical protein